MGRSQAQGQVRERVRCGHGNRRKSQTVRSSSRPGSRQTSHTHVINISYKGAKPRPCARQNLTVNHKLVPDCAVRVPEALVNMGRQHARDGRLVDVLRQRHLRCASDMGVSKYAILRAKSGASQHACSCRSQKRPIEGHAYNGA